MTAFESAWIFLKNAPVPNYAQPKQPSDFTAMEDKRRRETHTDRYIDGRERERYGIVERMPRPEVGSGESSFDSERMNTGTSVFNPIPSWQDMGQQANAANDSMQTFGTAQPPAVAQQGQHPQYTPELYNALMGLQQPNDQSKAIPRG
jgi:hypothetical protein